MKKIFIATFLSIQILFAADIYATFDVVSDKSSELGLSTSGVVGTLHVNVGDKLKKGELLLSLENSSERQEVENAKIALETAKRHAEFAKQTYERYAAISQVINQEKMDKYIYDKDIAFLNVKSAQTTLALKEIALRKTELRAPYDLVVTKKNTELGDIVLGSQTKLISAVSLDDVKLVLKFDEKYWQKIKVGQSFSYKVDGSDKNYEGKITKVYPTILSATREMQAEVKAKDLLPGLFGNGTIKAE